MEWSAAPELLTPQIHESDPREIRPPSRPEPAADPTTDPTSAPAPDPAPVPAPAPAADPLADTARWTPEQTLIVGDFDAVGQLADALRTVDPALRGEGLPDSSESHEATMLRIGNLVGSGKVTLTPAQASRFTGKLPSGGSASVQLTLYRPQTESASRSITLMGLRTTIRSASSAGSQTYSPGVNVPLSGGLTTENTDTFSGSVPVAGENITTGQSTGVTSFRREIIKYGTGLSQNADEEQDESGVLGFTVTAHVLLEVSGPEGTRWVTGNVVARATLEDALGLGLAAMPPRPSPNVYDAPAVLAAHEASDRVRDPESFGEQLAAAFTDEDTAPQVWFDPGDVPAAARRALLGARTALLAGGTLDDAREAAGTGLPEALSALMGAAAHATGLAHRPVTLVLRTPTARSTCPSPRRSGGRTTHRYRPRHRSPSPRHRSPSPRRRSPSRSPSRNPCPYRRSW
ncbi:hypothetical protein O1L68_18065 [Streptomyces lydicus]|nr:hypothetical protein [Streptomyces lydicus]